MKPNLALVAFQKCAEFLTLKEIFNILCLNKYFYNHFKNNQVTFCIGINQLSAFIKEKVNPDNFKQVFYENTGLQITSALEIPNICRFSKNLISNPCGKYNFDGWKRKDGGNGWAIENFLTFQDNLTCFVSSFEWGFLSTSIDLPELGIKRKIIIGSPVCRRLDCGGQAKLELSITNKHGGKKYAERVIVPKLKETKAFRGNWELLSLSMDIDDYDIKADIKFLAKDENFWAGHYGPRFGYCYARILALDNIST